MGRRADQQGDPTPRGRRRLVAGLVGVAVIALAGGWLGFRAQQARPVVEQVRADADLLRRQLAADDLTAAGATLARLRGHAEHAHRLTSDPVWAVASVLPGPGREVRAAREVSAVAAAVTEAARPLEVALPRLLPAEDPSAVVAASTGTTRSDDGEPVIDIEALGQVADAVPALSAAVTDGAVRLGRIDPAGLRPSTAAGVTTATAALQALRPPLAGAVPVMSDLPAMLGGDGPRTWMVLLQQDAEARGTGGLVGAYAVLRTDGGRIDLLNARSRGVLDRGPRIPSSGVPAELRDLWGGDLTEWAGLNLSPHFPWTGRLVADGWTARYPSSSLDHVAAIDQHLVAALLAGTGPVTVRGVRVDSAGAVDFLSRGVYSRWPDPRDVDAVTTELVHAVFERVGSGRLDLRALLAAAARPAGERRLLVWSAETEEQSRLEAVEVGGALPGEPGAFAMAVVNNGGGNKLDAYLKVHTDYLPGVCAQGVRVGHIVVTLENTAPQRGLPEYVTVRSDLLEQGRGQGWVAGSNRVLLDVYGPVGSRDALTTVDGRPVAPVRGFDRNHSVWRVAVPLQPGQRRVVDVALAAPVVEGDAGTTPTVRLQPLVIPATAATRRLSACPPAAPVTG